jgi:chitodextrinase
MQKFLVAALTATSLVLAATSGAVAAPVAPIGKAAGAIDARSTVQYYGYHYRHYHRHCWWRYGRRICRW